MTKIEANRLLVRRVWEEQGFAPVPLEGATELDPFPQGQPFSFEALNHWPRFL